MIREAIAKLVERGSLTPVEAEGVMGEIMRGEATHSQIGAFLTALRMKGETVEEIAGCARAMRSCALRVRCGRQPLVDTCGTGGDGTGSFNISTAVSFVVAGSGLAVAKHGNRAVSSLCGSADLLEALGARIDLGPVEVGKCIDEVGIGFLFAPRLHPAMKNVALPRREMGIRTIFNILGPLTNPAGASIQLMGVYHPDLTEPLARVLALLGTERAMVVHGADSLDELSTTGTNKITQLVEGEVSSYYLNPRELGLATASLDELKGGTPEENAREMRALLGGEGGAKRDAVLLNSSAMLMIADRATDFSSGLALAAEVIDSGRALDRLDRFIEVSQSFSSIEI